MLEEANDEALESSRDTIDRTTSDPEGGKLLEFAKF